ncbi:uncharacterized protein Z520_06178 [Fonsecaea multimorphosa CBS 102226]|uniref:Xylanolytic transcriptional activator regulatory domain-containing protein n=1 Tax=Fonsecaea multimorphosa CBS 102226 TaxID=1442371 RepID=A0A0D2KN17_9EURO|nr:uncharacterized protein Z520_06178 [Fonsecaea multimorphosa CBS 102226]KIX98098.1 hypothetical protein Z520_06178 [Fonsecaea multimorphosa CBS 102226]
MEQELARTQAILREATRGSPRSQQRVDDHTSSSPKTTGTGASLDLSNLTSFQDQTMFSMSDQTLSTSFLVQDSASVSNSDQPHQQRRHDPAEHMNEVQPTVNGDVEVEKAIDHVLSSSRSTKKPWVSLEKGPPSGDFDWDERNELQTANNFVDGMAALTSESNGGGYLGVASGAAMLRLTGASDQSPARDQKRASTTIPYAITSLSFLEGFLDAYFMLFHRSYPIVHEATFRAQFMEMVPRPRGQAWHVLLYAMCAIGAWTSATQQSDIDLGLFEASKSRMSSDMLETGNLTLVQALTLIANYVQKRDKPNSGYNYTGLARRIAMGIGLHKEFPNWQTSLLTQEMRRRVWWSLYVLDVGAIITFSRPLDFPDRGIETELPLNVHDADFTALTPQKPSSANETTLYSHLRAQSTFHLATCQIYSCIISTPYPSPADLLQQDDSLIGAWLSGLPTYFQEHSPQPPRYALCHSILSWRYRNFRILMYRPFLVRRQMARAQTVSVDSSEDMHSEEMAIQRCLDAARESISLISKFWDENEKTMMASWYSLFFLFQAILIPVICLRNDPQAPEAEGWQQQVLVAIRVMESMLQVNPTSERCLRVVRSLTREYLGASGGWGGPTEESPQTQLNNLYPLMWPTLESAQFDGVDAML